MLPCWSRRVSGIAGGDGSQSAARGDSATGGRRLVCLPNPRLATSLGHFLPRRKEVLLTESLGSAQADGAQLGHRQVDEDRLVADCYGCVARRIASCDPKI